MVLAAGAIAVGPVMTQPIHAIPSGRARLQLWHDDPELVQALAWVASETPAASTALAPPWRPEVFYYGRRAVVANWQAIRYDALPEWRARIEHLVGPLHRPSLADMERGYLALTTEDVRNLVHQYGVDYFITSGHYAFPIMHRAGAYYVYQLGGEAAGSDSGPSDGASP